MISVVIAANNQEKKFINALQNIISRNFRAIHCMARCLDARCENAELLLTDIDSFDLVYSETAIIVFKDSAKLPLDFQTNKQMVAIVDSCNKDAVRIASDTKVPAITCGLSACDTITLSSISEDSAVIDLQRCVTCFDGTIAEPQEIPVSLCSSIDSFALMCAAAIFVLSGNIKKLSEVKI